MWRRWYLERRHASTTLYRHATHCPMFIKPLFRLPERTFGEGLHEDQGWDGGLWYGIYNFSSSLSTGKIVRGMIFALFCIASIVAIVYLKVNVIIICPKLTDPSLWILEINISDFIVLLCTVFNLLWNWNYKSILNSLQENN